MSRISGSSITPSTAPASLLTAGERPGGTSRAPRERSRAASIRCPQRGSSMTAQTGGSPPPSGSGTAPHRRIWVMPIATRIWGSVSVIVRPFIRTTAVGEDSAHRAEGLPAPLVPSSADLAALHLMFTPKSTGAAVAHVEVVHWSTARLRGWPRGVAPPARRAAPRRPTRCRLHTGCRKQRMPPMRPANGTTTSSGALAVVVGDGRDREPPKTRRAGRCRSRSTNACARTGPPPR
jgi:hypothetical protein